jgi:hypothetical protein
MASLWRGSGPHGAVARRVGASPVLEAMPATIHLNDIIDALEMQLDESLSYWDLDAGQVVTVSADVLRDAEEHGDEEPDVPDWQKDEWEIAKRIVSTDRFRPLPTKFDVHEWEIMQDFSRSAGSDAIRDDLLRAIHGFGRLRSMNSIHRARPGDRIGRSSRFRRLSQAGSRLMEATSNFGVAIFSGHCFNATPTPTTNADNDIGNDQLARRAIGCMRKS